jgi:hypothetical protein
MADLIQEFFNRDLTEAEQESLSKLLEGSPDAALRYEALLEQNYLATGLPQPTLPEGLQSLPQPGNGSIPWWTGSVKFVAVGLVAAGIALWKFWPEPKPVPPLSTQQVPALPAARPAEPEAIRPLPIRPSAAQTAQEGQELSVLVDVPRKALVTVHILDEGGAEVRNLYTGFVETGRWTFRWDGLLENGETAKSGQYRIDVQSGAAHQSKDIQINLQPVTP